MTPQGRFADPRELPLAFKPGLAALALRAPTVPLIPLAVEYSFWDERLPETLLRFGSRVEVPTGATTAEATRELEDALARSMHALAAAAMARDASAFTVLLSGTRGTGGFYGLIRRFSGFLRGRTVDLDHTQRAAN